ncbi:MAG: peptidylprolyl isomerase [Lachnospiraceae bacterium]|nr:peptidylprolyl isomerase [Lachnospiraceae bacterium]
MNRMIKTGARFLLLGLTIAAMLILGGCKTENETNLVLTTGLDDDEVFRIETTSCSQAEMQIYLANMQNQYEAIFGDGIWNTDLAGKKLESNIKDTVLAKIAQVKVMTLLSDQYGVELTDHEKELARQAADAYFATLDQAEIKALGATTDVVRKIYREYALADKVYHFIIRDITPEISDDEARTITVEHILFKTYSLDSNGEKIPYSEAEKAEVRARAEKVLQKIRAGEDFEAMVSAYNEDNKSIYSFGLGDMEQGYEKAAFDLGTDEISDIVETVYGYHIIKCLNTFNREETDANKRKIVEKRRREVFSREYDVFADSLMKNLNQPLVDKITIFRDPAIKTDQLLTIYEEHFSGVFE